MMVATRPVATADSSDFFIADGDVGALIAAIDALNASLGGTIHLAAGGTYTLTREHSAGNGLPAIGSIVILRGNGATIERNDDERTPEFRIFEVLSGGLIISGVTIEGGRHSIGAGILNHATLMVTESTVARNHASLYGGGIYNQPGALLLIDQSTIAFNTADASDPRGCHSCAYGGGVNNWGDADIINSTIANNSAGFSGGGVYSNGVTRIFNTTVADNRSLNFGAGVVEDSGGRVTLGNMILARNLSFSIGQANCSWIASPLDSLGDNISDDCTCFGSLNEDGDLNDTNPGLDDRLRNNGGPTETLALLEGSVAIDAGNDGRCAVRPVSGHDQRGVLRPVGAACDIGAFEFEAEPEDADAPPSITCGAADGLWHADDVSIVCTASDEGSGLANPADASFVLTTSVPAGTETAGAETNSRKVCDQADNCATAGPIGGNMIDKKAPTITLTTPAASSYLLNQVIAGSFSCADGGSGIGTCAGTSANSAPIATSAVDRTRSL